MNVSDVGASSPVGCSSAVSKCSLVAQKDDRPAPLLVGFSPWAKFRAKLKALAGPSERGCPLTDPVMVEAGIRRLGFAAVGRGGDLSWKRQLRALGPGTFCPLIYLV